MKKKCLEKPLFFGLAGSFLLIAMIVPQIAACGKIVPGIPNQPIPVQSSKVDSNSPLNVFSFGASPAASPSANVAAFQAALDFAWRLKGAKIWVPRGNYRLDAPLQIHPLTLMQGEGRYVSTLTFTNDGNGIVSVSSINQSTRVGVGVRDIGILNNGSANVGGGFVDVGGSFVDLSNIFVAGWKYQIIFDQTEIASVDLSEIDQLGKGEVGIWLVNGSDHTDGANEMFTNRITISRNQFNSNKSGAENILDDGGGAHSIRDNNFNSGESAARVAGVAGFVFEGNESEGHARPLVLTASKAYGKYVGPCSAPTIEGNTFTDIAASHIVIEDAVGGSISNNFFNQARLGSIVFSGTEPKASGVIVEGNSKQTRGKYKQASPFVRASPEVFSNNFVTQSLSTYSETGIAGVPKLAIVTPATMEGIEIGGRLLVKNEDGTSAESIIVLSVDNGEFGAFFRKNKSAGFLIQGSGRAHGDGPIGPDGEHVPRSAQDLVPANGSLH